MNTATPPTSPPESVPKKTCLYDHHVALGGKIVSFAGFFMPVYYQGIVPEHLTVRNQAGLFDVSHMGEFTVEGPGAETFLEEMTVNRVSTLQAGQAQYTAMCYPNGGIVDDLILYRYPEKFMLVVNAANIQKDFSWLQEHLPTDVRLSDHSEAISLVALQGPISREILQPMTATDLKDLPFYHFVETDVAGQSVTLSRTGYTGELGFEIYGSNQAIPIIWETLLNKGKRVGLTPVGLGARDTLRLEMKYCLYGNDIDATTNPLEAGLGWIVKLDKKHFIGKEALVEIKSNLNRRLVCLEMIDRAIPRPGYSIFADDEEVGVVTSGTQSPSLKKGIALAYLRLPWSKQGSLVEVQVRNRRQRAVVVKPPFYRHGTAHS